MKTSCSVSVVVFLMLLSACAAVSVDECRHYQTPLQQSYCYVSREVTAVRQTLNQSYRDGVVTRDELIRADQRLDNADVLLDGVWAALTTGDNDQATHYLSALKTLLLEVNHER